VVEQILDEIGAGNRPRYLVLNKIDRVQGESMPVSPEIRKGYGRVLSASAVTGEGLEDVREEIIRYFTRTLRRYCFLIPYDKGGILARLHKEGVVEQEEYTQEGTIVRGFLPEPTYNEFKYLTVK
jgi:GTP-binding protein HflX